MSKKFSSRKAAIDAVVKCLKNEVGYLEKATNKSLDSKTANAGKNNITKYWRDLNNWGLMGKPKGWAGGPDWSWCAGTQTWAFIKTFGKDAAKQMLLHIPFISCQTLGDKAKAKSQLKDSPKRGDLVLFWNGSRFHHVGYVYSVTDTVFKTIEGNTSSGSAVVPNGGGVHKKEYNIAAAKRAGHKFVRIKYACVIEKKPTPAAPAPKKDAGKTTATSASSKSKTYLTIATKTNPLKCREKASKTAAVVGKFAKGAKVELIKVGSKTGTWTKVTGTSTSGKKITGWCMSKYLKK